MKELRRQEGRKKEKIKSKEKKRKVSPVLKEVFLKQKKNSELIIYKMKAK
jgi:hypothetical protein